MACYLNYLYWFTISQNTFAYSFVSENSKHFFFILRKKNLNFLVAASAKNTRFLLHSRMYSRKETKNIDSNLYTNIQTFFYEYLTNIIRQFSWISEIRVNSRINSKMVYTYLFRQTSKMKCALVLILFYSHFAAGMCKGNILSGHVC